MSGSCRVEEKNPSSGREVAAAKEDNDDDKTNQNNNMPGSGCLPGLLFARCVMPLLSSVVWTSPFLCSDFSCWEEKKVKYSRVFLSSEYQCQPRSAHINSTMETIAMTDTRFRARDPCYKCPFYSWGIMFAQTQLGAFEKMRDSVSQDIHLWPSHCLPHWGCNLSCNPSHFCLRLSAVWDSHLDMTALKFTFLYKRRTWIVVNLRAIPHSCGTWSQPYSEAEVE